MVAGLSDFRRKTLLIILDGMEDECYDSIGGLTPVDAADAPALHGIMQTAECRRVMTIPEGEDITSENAILTILGYDVRLHSAPRGILEALGCGLDLAVNDLAFRCNIVTVFNGVVVNTQAGGVSADEAESVARMVSDHHLMPERWQWIGGRDHRNLIVVRNGIQDTPEYCEAVARRVSEEFAKLPELEIMNNARRRLGKPEINGLWIWGGGGCVSCYERFCDKYGIASGCVLAGTSLLKGIAYSIGLDAPDIEGATGDVVSDFAAKARYAVSALSQYDFILLHAEAPDEASHLRDEALKRDVISRIDRELLEPVLSANTTHEVILMSDHLSLCRTGRHAAGAVRCWKMDCCQFAESRH